MSEKDQIKNPDLQIEDPTFPVEVSSEGTYWGGVVDELEISRKKITNIF